MGKSNFIMKQVVFLSFLLISSCGGSESSEVTEVWPDGSEKTIQYYKDTDGKRQIIRIEEYHENGVRRLVGYYKDGERHGKWNSWHENEQLWSVARYSNGQLEGKQTVYYPSGQKHYEGTFRKGIRTGLWRFWDEQGILVTEKDYSLTVD